MRKIAILVPSYDGKVCCNFSLSIAEIFRIGASMPDISFHLQYLMHEALIQRARNNLINDAYDQGMDDVVFIDADQSFDPQAFFKLINYPVDVVGIPVRMKTEENRYNIRPESCKEHKMNADLGLIEVAAIGTGFLRLTRKAIEAVFELSEYYNDGDSRRANAFEIRIFKGEIVSEDIIFCNKLTEAGFTIYVSPAYTAKHFGTKCWEGNFLDYYIGNIKEDLINQAYLVIDPSPQTPSA